MSTVSTATLQPRATMVRRLGAASATIALAAAALVGLSGPAQASEVTETFASPNGTNWTVPPGVDSVQVEVVGANGGSGDILDIPIIGLPLTGDGAGGVGHVISATLDVTAGQVLTFYGSTAGGPVGSRHNPGAGGLGYRNGGDAGTGSLSANAGGGGGGASAVVAGDDLIVAAGGGGGAGRGAGFAGCYGGHGGNADMAGFGAYGICAGGGPGGSAGVAANGHGTTGEDADAGSSSSGGGGGGGGAGYLGGAHGHGSTVGGAGGGGGGGGTSYVSSGVFASEPVIRDARGNGFVRITYNPSFSTQTEVIADPVNSVYGQAVTYTASVSNTDTSATPLGTANLFHGDRLLGSVALVDGQAVFPAIMIDVGPAQVRAEYEPANEDFQTSAGTVDVTIAPGATTTVLQLQPRDAVVGQGVTATAQVGPVSPASGTVGGMVEFSADGDVLGQSEVIDGVATWDFNAGGAGAQDIAATYLGSEWFETSAAVVRTLQVEPGQTQTEVLSAPSPSVRGQQVDLEAQVQVEAPAAAEVAGTVQFHLDGEAFGPAQQVQDGTAVLTTTQLPVGAGTISAEYSGSDDLHPSTSADHEHIVDRAEAQIVLSTDDDVLTYGQTLELSAQVDVRQPGEADISGQVEFFAGEQSLGTSEVATSSPESIVGADLPQSEMVLLEPAQTTGTASLQVADLEVGDHVLTAVYSGNTDVHPATSDELDLLIEMAEVRVTVTSDPQASVFGEPVQLSAAVSPDHDSELLATGQVQFDVDGLEQHEPVTLVDGVATVEVDELAVGDRQIVAHYLGDDGHTEASSEVHQHQVGQGATATALSPSTTQLEGDEALSLVADVEVLEPAQGEPSGQVQFLLDEAPLGEPIELEEATAALQLEALEPGAYVLQAQYTGEENFTGSISSEVGITVVEPAPSDADVGAGSGGVGQGGTGQGGAGLPSTGAAGAVALVAVAALLLLTGAAMLIRRQGLVR